MAAPASAPPSAAADLHVTTGPRRGQVTVQVRQDGRLVTAETVPIHDLGKQSRLAQRLGLPLERLHQAITDATAQPPGPAGPFTVRLRGQQQPRAQGRELTAEAPLAALDLALAILDHPALQPVIEWDGTDRLAAVDVDFHDQELARRPTIAQLGAIAAACQPRPARWWATHGRGLRLIHEAAGGLTAHELAACATLALRGLRPDAGIEVLDHTRHPGYPRPGHPLAGPVHLECPTADLGPLARWLGRTIDPAAVEAWRAERQWQRDGRYPHDQCPANPSPSHNDPVCVGEQGVHCFKCAGEGVVLGHRRPGWFPWAALIGGGPGSHLAQAARHLVHWEQAQHYLAEGIGLTGPLAEPCYRALLKAVHGPDDPRIALAMQKGQGLVRMDGCWATADLARPHRSEGLRQRLEQLPALLERRERAAGPPELCLDTERLGHFLGVDDLARFGYLRIQPIRGMRIFHQFQPSAQPDVVRAVVLPPALRAEAAQPYRPRYRPPGRRMALAEAERQIVASFPGIRLDYLQLLIAARGCAEGGVGPPALIAVDGPSGSGKSRTIPIAAALIGDHHLDVTWSPNVEAFRMALAEASRAAGLVSCDELIKLATARGGDIRSQLSPLLTFAPGATVRQLYVGHVEVPPLPALILTDTAYPLEVLRDQQIGRRFVHVHLERAVDWGEGAQGAVDRWRTRGRDQAAAADALVSTVIDRFFAGPEPMTFEAIARSLGFGLLKEGPDHGIDPQADLRELFAACCDPTAPVAPGHWRGMGWKLAQRFGEDRLSQAWRSVCDHPGEGFTTSRRVSEVDWACLLGVVDPVECDFQPNGGSTLGIRFRSGRLRARQTRYNAEITAPATAAPIDALPTPSPRSEGLAPAGTPESRGDMKVRAGAAPAPPCVAVAVPAGPPAGPVAGPGAEVLIDLETRSCCDLVRAGARAYAADPTTCILTAAALLDGQIIVWVPSLDLPLPTDALWPDGPGSPLPIRAFVGPELPPPLTAAIAAGRPFVAHNALDFDARVWKAQGLPEPACWRDTLPEARAAGLPGRLEELGQRLLGRGKGPDGQQLIQRLCRPDDRGQLVPLSLANAVALVRYNLRDVLLLAELRPLLQGHAEPEVLAIDQVINDRGIAFDADLARALIRLEDQMAQVIAGEVATATAGGLAAADLTSLPRLQRWLRSQGVVLANLQRETILRFLDEHEATSPVVARALQARLSINRTTTARLERALAQVGADGRLRDLLVYHKAHTGRWAGRAFQPHNLPRPPEALRQPARLLAHVDDAGRFQAALPVGVTVADALTALVRPCLRAADGHVLAIADLAGIEARGVAWCAGEHRLLQQFTEGVDAYCELAARIFGRPVTRADELERKVGKEAVLGCGYGMGAARFAAGCRQKGIDLARAGTTAEAVIEGYRDACPAIAGARGGQGHRRGGLWWDVQDAAVRALRSGAGVAAGRCRFARHGTALVVQLPSGRRLRYPHARIEDRVPQRAGKAGWSARPRPTVVYDEARKLGVETYGGKLVENVVQAICRDLLAAALMACEAAGLAVVLHVHDEVVIETTAARAEADLERLVQVMTTPPAWAVGFPLQAEGFVADRYGKSALAGAARATARQGVVLA